MPTLLFTSPTVWKLKKKWIFFTYCFFFFHSFLSRHRHFLIFLLVFAVYPQLDSRATEIIGSESWKEASNFTLKEWLRAFGHKKLDYVIADCWGVMTYAEIRFISPLRVNHRVPIGLVSYFWYFSVNWKNLLRPPLLGCWWNW